MMFRHLKTIQDLSKKLEVAKISFETFQLNFCCNTTSRLAHACNIVLTAKCAAEGTEEHVQTYQVLTAIFGFLVDNELVPGDCF